MHTRFGRVVAARDVDHVAIGVGAHLGQIAGVVVAELARAHPLIFNHRGPPPSWNASGTPMFLWISSGTPARPRRGLGSASGLVVLRHLTGSRADDEPHLAERGQLDE
jgi:hypothetical protein